MTGLRLNIRRAIAAVVATATVAIAAPVPAAQAAITLPTPAPIVVAAGAMSMTDLLAGVGDTGGATLRVSAATVYTPAGAVAVDTAVLATPFYDGVVAVETGMAASGGYWMEYQVDTGSSTLSGQVPIYVVGSLPSGALDINYPATIQAGTIQNLTVTLPAAVDTVKLSIPTAFTSTGNAVITGVDTSVDLGAPTVSGTDWTVSIPSNAATGAVFTEAANAQGLVTLDLPVRAPSFPGDVVITALATRTITDPALGSRNSVSPAAGVINYGQDDLDRASTAPTRLTVTVEGYANRAPESLTLAPFVLPATGSIALGPTDVASDPDGDNLTFTSAIVIDTSVAKAVYTGASLTLSRVSAAAGSTWVVATVLDGLDETEVRIPVYAPASAPNLVATAQTRVASGATWDVTAGFKFPLSSAVAVLPEGTSLVSASLKTGTKTVALDTTTGAGRKVIAVPAEHATLWTGSNTVNLVLRIAPTVAWGVFQVGVAGTGSIVTPLVDLEGNAIDPATVWYGTAGASGTEARATVQTIVGNAAPTVTNLTAAIDAGTVATVSLQANDPDADPITFQVGRATNVSVTVTGSTAKLNIDAAHAGGKVTLPITATDNYGISGNGTLTITVTPRGVATATVKLTPPDKTKISWTAAPAAANYEVRADNEVICTVTELYCIVDELVARDKDVTVTAITATNARSRAVAAARSSQQVTLYAAKFVKKRTALASTAANAIANVADALADGGYSRVTVNALTGPSKASRTLAVKRANAVAAQIKSASGGQVVATIKTTPGAPGRVLVMAN